MKQKRMISKDVGYLRSEGIIVLFECDSPCDNSLFSGWHYFMEIDDKPIGLLQASQFYFDRNYRNINDKT